MRELLENHIYGVDKDPDACHVAELSLILTLLDYVTPPDLERYPNFKLPSLQNQNIFQADFFEVETSWTEFAENIQFNWIVGNPPWISISSNNITNEDLPIWNWMQSKNVEFPVGGHQTAEAFAWKVTEHISEDGVIGLLLPAMTLFKDESKDFRKNIFGTMQFWCIANFANMAYVLFAGRAEVPAAAFFYTKRIISKHKNTKTELNNEKIVTYSPFVANQVANRPFRDNKKRQTWNIVINADEIRDVSLDDAITGYMLPWKIALWGSCFDWKLINKVQRKYPSFDEYKEENQLLVAEGLKKRDYPSEFNKKHTINLKTLKNCGKIFQFPGKSYVKLSIKKGKKTTLRPGLQVSYPPHIFLDGSRRFAIYSDQFIAIPSRHIGIAGSEKQLNLLKTMSLYLSSKFVTYHQFISSPESGIHSTRSTLRALGKLPMPFSQFNNKQYVEWAKLHSEIIEATQEIASNDTVFKHSNSSVQNERLSSLTTILNNKVYSLLRLNETEVSLVEDFVNVRMKLTKGKIGKEVSISPSEEEHKNYLLNLRNKLDSFVNNEMQFKHRIVSIFDNDSAMLSVGLQNNLKAIPPTMMRANSNEALQFIKIRENLLRKHSQWIYFNRNLRIYNGSTTYLFKPMQKMFWTKTRALLDASELIAETLSGGE